MNQSSEYKQVIKEAFSRMQSVEDLVNLLNFVYHDKHQGLLKDLSVKAFNYYCSPAIATDCYRTFLIKKKSGSNRTIHSPKRGLKAFQAALNVVFQQIFDFHTAATGFKPETSIVDNAKPHIGQNYVFNIDLKDFFSSIDQARIWKRLQFPPFNLNDTNGRLHLANKIAALCCTALEVERVNDNNTLELVKRNVLPQGAPTSPILSNVIAYRLDVKLTGLANRFGLQYTRYADDITFSSKHNVYQKDGDFTKELYRIIKDQNFTVNPEKTRLQKKGYRQATTGLTVNEKVNVKSEYVKQVRMWIYFWEKYGLNKAADLFKKDYAKDKGHNKQTQTSFVNVLDGKLHYLKMVKGSSDPTFTKLHERFIKLCAPSSTLAQLLTVWETKGIEEAIAMFSEIQQPYENQNS